MSALGTRGVCECGEVIEQAGQAWVHESGFYRCPPGQSSETGFAEKVEQTTIEDAYADGYEKARDEIEQEYDDSLADREDDARAEGRAEALADAVRALEDLS
ncbi:hypothetical protein SEA_MARIOKART_51 [Gordonia phage Mariokart]|nr:hypothetical protein SEA_MARIOKART_51 [Gordonia phage Mariokart]